MTRRSNVRSTKVDRNFRLPQDLIPQLTEALENLSPSRKNDYLKSVVFSKFTSLDTVPPSVRRQRAINKWLASEMNNEATNVRLLTVAEDYNILPRVGYRTFMRTVGRICEDVLGSVVPAESLLGGFSGGATTSRRRIDAHPARKYVGEAHVTNGALELALSVIVGSPLWCSTLDHLEVVPGNVMFTVPKNTEIDRCCCKEPDLNVYLQKGVGDYIRRRLRFSGIDLNDQSRNRGLARQGSIDGSLATIDLSAASDSISTELVRQALPEHWFAILSMLRSEVTIIDGEVHKNEMFSSMGNGFTFELESLLFYAIARATAYHLGISGVLSVFGDDIIIPTSIAHYLIGVLSFLGFETNISKSFVDGSFRESCGGHFENGFDITPFYIRKPISTLLDLIHFLNQLRKWADVGVSVLDPEVEPLWCLLARLVPDELWGGTDHADKTRLVSAWQPPKPARLRALTSKKTTGTGGYLLWLDLTTERSTAGDVQTSLEARETGAYRVKPVRSAYAVTDTWFLSEIAGGRWPIDRLRRDPGA